MAPCRSSCLEVQPAKLADAKSGAVEQLEDRPVAHAGRGVRRRRLDHLLGGVDRQERRKPAPHLRRRQLVGRAGLDVSAPPHPAHPRPRGRDLAGDGAGSVAASQHREPGTQQVDVDRPHVVRGLRASLAREERETLDVAAVLGHGPRRCPAFTGQVAQKSRDRFVDRHVPALPRGPSAGASSPPGIAPGSPRRRRPPAYSVLGAAVRSAEDGAPERARACEAGRPSRSRRALDSPGDRQVRGGRRLCGLHPLRRSRGGGAGPRDGASPQPPVGVSRLACRDLPGLPGDRLRGDQGRPSRPDRRMDRISAPRRPSRDGTSS